MHAGTHGCRRTWPRYSNSLFSKAALSDTRSVVACGFCKHRSQDSAAYSALAQVVNMPRTQKQYAAPPNLPRAIIHPCHVHPHCLIVFLSPFVAGVCHPDSSSDCVSCWHSSRRQLPHRWCADNHPGVWQLDVVGFHTSQPRQPGGWDLKWGPFQQ